VQIQSFGLLVSFDGSRTICSVSIVLIVALEVMVLIAVVASAYYILIS